MEREREEPGSPRLAALFALHAEALEHQPVLAHWTAAGFATLFGCVLAAGRGAFVAVTQPAGLRWAAFANVSRSVAPLYIIPFVLGSQLDCYEQTWARRGHQSTGTWSGAAADLG